MRQMRNGRRNARPTIAHLLPWPALGGVEIATTRLMRSTSDRFHHVAFCIRGSRELIAACQQAGAEVVEYVPPEPSARHFLRFLSESRLVAGELKRCGAEIAHCSEIKAAYHNSLAAMLAGVPMITHVRSRFSKLPFRERLMMTPTKRYVFVSKDSWRQFAVKVPARRARVLYDAVSIAEPDGDAATVRQELGIPSEAPLVGMVARVNPQKDYFTLAAAAVKVVAKRPDTRFVVVGDNAQVELNRQHYAQVKQRLEELGVSKSFLFTGFREDIPRLVAAMDVFVLSTHREGMPLSIIEAMGMGKPVVATAVDGIPEIVTDGITGLLYRHEDSEGLADAILECIEDPERAASLGNAARERVRTEYTIKAYAQNLGRIYEEIL
jgi:glycosyltransferase involved in cell wall biosynthesis